MLVLLNIGLIIINNNVFNAMPDVQFALALINIHAKLVYRIIFYI